MITHLNLPVSIPWTAKTNWESFGDTFDMVEMDGKDISADLRKFMSDLKIQPIALSKFAVFPDKKQTIYVDAPWCEINSHTRIIWVDGADIQITWFDITEELGLDNIDKLFGIKEKTDDDNFTNPKTGWVVNPAVLKVKRKEVVKSGEVVLINAGVPYIVEAITPVRAKLYVLGVEKENRVVNDRNGLPYDDALIKFADYVK